MNKIIAFIALLLYSNVEIVISAQQYIYQHFTTADGLPSSEVYHVFQDSKGYIWFATDNGVSRYNGYEFENFDVNDGLPVNSTSEIYEDFKGRIWFIGMNRMLSYYNNKQISEYKYSKKLFAYFNKGQVPLKSSFFVDPIENIYISIAKEGLYVINTKGDIMKVDSLNTGVTIFNRFNERTLASFNYYSPIIKELWLYNPETVTKMKLDLTPKGIPRHIFTLKLGAEEYLFSINEKIFLINANKVSLLKVMKKPIQYLSLDNHNKIWLCYKDGGIDCFENIKLSDLTKKHFLKNENTSSVMQDQNQGLWFTTLNKGVYYVPSSEFINYNTEDGLVSNDISCIARDKTTMWLGYNTSYVNRISTDKKILSRIRIGEVGTIKSIVADTISKIVYVGTPDWIYSLYGNSIVKTLKNNHSKINPKKIGQTYFNTNNLCLFDSALWICGGYAFIKIKNDKVIFDSSRDNNFLRRVNKLFFSDSIIWIAAEDGLYKMENNKIEVSNISKSALNIRIIDIIKKYNTLFLATKGRGILVFDKSLKQIMKIDGLCDNNISCILLRDSILWSGSAHGLCKTELTIRNDKIKIGKTTRIPELARHEIRQILGWRDSLYLATDKGLIVYSLQNTDTCNNSIPIYITDLKSNDIKQSLQSNINLTHSQNNLQIRFEALFYKDPASIQYKYKLIGLDKNWIKTTNREARYYYLPPGEYTFIVKAQNYNGEVSVNQANVTFKIVPAIWQTIHFKIGLSLIIFPLLILFYQIKIHSTKQKAFLRKNMYTYMMKALIGQMNPHFIFNTLNSINNYILTNEKKAASIYLVRFSKLIRRILNNSRQIYVPLADEIEALKLYIEIEAMRLKNKFEYSVEYAKDLDINSTRIPCLLIQPFIENSIWHGIQPSSRHGILKIFIKQDTEALIIEITDNGIGRKKSLLNSNMHNDISLGTRITNNRFDLLSKTLNKEAKIEYTDLYQHDESIGTHVKLIIPIIKERNQHLV